MYQLILQNRKIEPQRNKTWEVNDKIFIAAE